MRRYKVTGSTSPLIKGKEEEREMLITGITNIMADVILPRAGVADISETIR